MVCCPERYWKWGNVVLVCERLGVKVLGTLAELGEGIVKRLEAMGSGESGAEQRTRHKHIKLGDINLGREEPLGE